MVIGFSRSKIWNPNKFQEFSSEFILASVSTHQSHQRFHVRKIFLRHVPVVGYLWTTLILPSSSRWCLLFTNFSIRKALILSFFTLKWIGHSPFINFSFIYLFIFSDCHWSVTFNIWVVICIYTWDKVEIRVESSKSNRTYLHQSYRLATKNKWENDFLRLRHCLFEWKKFYSLLT